MNNIRNNQPRRGPQRNTSQSPSHIQQDSQSISSSQSSLEQSSNTGASGSNEQRQNSFRFQRNNNNEGGKGLYKPKKRPQGKGSDSESDSSDDSQTNGINEYSDSENGVTRCPERIGSHGYSEGDSNNYVIQNAAENVSARNLVSNGQDFERQQSNDESSSDKFSANQRELVKSANSSDHINNNVSELSLEHKNDKLAALLNYKKMYDQLLNEVEPSQLIKRCREHIDQQCKESMKQIFNNISVMQERLSSNDKCAALKLRLDNLYGQQNEFEATVANVRGQLSKISLSDIQVLIKSTDAIKEDFKNECKLFKRSLPAYAFKSKILKQIKENQVTIISSDASYLLNILLPIFVKKEFMKHYLVCCETSQMLSTSLKRNVSYYMCNKESMDEVAEKELVNSIQFMVVEELLILFSNDYTVDEKNMFVILNLSLKRSLNLDIVLANLKDMLENHDEARVVLLTSHCEHPEKYENYFAEQSDVSIIKLPNLTLPVKTVWKSLSLLPNDDDYIDEVVKTALAIHTLNDAGDILVFLPNQSICVEINERFSSVNYDNFECVILAENSTSLDLFARKKSAKRTMFLATECAEVLVIPSVNHVIDCGLKKEYMFDVNKKLDVLTTTFISRDKCKLRKSLAGAFSEGVCYRLYNKDNFCKEMPSYEYPEILTVNPFNSMIQVFQHRPGTATTVEFVESMPESIKENALKLLKKYNAVKDNILTELGKNIVKLPFPAKYSNLILLGIQWGLAFEAVVLVAFFLVKGRVFKVSADLEQQRIIDAVKLQLVKHDSEPLSYLFIYKTWLENSSLESSNKDSINFETLRSVQTKVDEICQIVGESLRENIAQEFSKAKDCSETLLELLFECFQENLCVFTGHNNSGYRILSSRCIAFLHPSSITCQMENLTEFIIFDHMDETDMEDEYRTRDFLVTITTIPLELVMEKLENLNKDFDYSDMFEKPLDERVIEPLEGRMITQVLLGKKGEKLRVIEDQIKKSLSTTSLVIKPKPHKGHVLVYALESQIEKAVVLVEKILQDQFEDQEVLNSEQTEVGSSGKTVVPIKNNLEDKHENPSDVTPVI